MTSFFVVCNCICAILLISGLFSACQKDDNNAQIQLQTTKKEVIETYANIVYASYSDSYDKANDLLTKVNSFIATPTQANFELCRQAWKDARIPYGQTEGYRFYGGFIDGDNGVEGLVNSWPMDEGYIDYVEGDANAGIINNTSLFPTITKVILTDLNGNGSETNIATGYHAIEFLLWGQDLFANSAGQRPFTDFVSGNGSTAKNQNRRREYLKVVTELLVENLAQLKAAWQPNSNNYRKKFTENTNYDATIGSILRGICILSKGELAGQRMTVALTNQDQEEEHSCFSDNTHIDIQMNFKSIQNIYFGTYKTVNGQIITGKSLKDMIAAADNTKSTAVLSTFTDTEKLVNAIPSPFDQAILNDAKNNNVIANSINKLKKLSDQIVDGAFSLKITVDTTE